MMTDLRAAAEKALEWVEGAQFPSGGISAWFNPRAGYGDPYPEVTGYIIPTLLNWGRDDLAEKCTGFLLKNQNSDGSFDGLDGIPRAFDTAACLEGLVAYPWKDKGVLEEAASRADDWIRDHCTHRGILINHPDSQKSSVYLARVAGLLDMDMEYWVMALRNWEAPDRRTHYFAYALDGLWMVGMKEETVSFLKLVPTHPTVGYWYDSRWARGDGERDLCATSQLALLFARSGQRDPMKYIEAVASYQLPGGGIPSTPTSDWAISWGVKWFLDAVYEVLK